MRKVELVSSKSRAAGAHRQGLAGADAPDAAVRVEVAGVPRARVRR